MRRENEKGRANPMAMSAEERQQMLLTQPVEKIIPKMALPTICSMLITSIYNMADTYFVSQIGTAEATASGTSASAAVGIVFSVMAMIQALAFMFGMGSGAAEIFGTSGGVAEAVLRCCLPDKSKNALREISILGLRGDAPIKEASVTIGDTELKLAVVNGLANAKKLLKEIDEGKKFYHLIEVMTCQGGCVGGAGQPYGLKKSKEKRGDGLHLSDNAAMFKRAERNPVVAQMMAEYGEERCHELLHVTYTNK